MTGTNSAVDNLAFGLSIAANAQIDADAANQRALQAQKRALEAEIALASQGSTDSVDERLSQSFERERLANAAFDAICNELKDSEKLVTEWMHSSAAFKRVAQKYSKELGIGQDDFDSEIIGAVIELSEEDPSFSNTRFLSKAIAKKHDMATKS